MDFHVALCLAPECFAVPFYISSVGFQMSAGREMQIARAELKV